MERISTFHVDKSDYAIDLVAAAEEVSRLNTSTLYHTAEHCIRVANSAMLSAHLVGADERQVFTAGMAGLWHDAIYRPLSPDNESGSAVAYARWSGGRLHSSSIRSIVYQAILDTDYRKARVASSYVGALVCDADLSIGLAGTRSQYMTNSALIKEEVISAGATDAQWVRGRSDFLNKWLNKPTIFRTAPYAWATQPAFENMAAELEHIQAKVATSD